MIIIDIKTAYGCNGALIESIRNSIKQYLKCKVSRRIRDREHAATWLRIAKQYGEAVNTLRRAVKADLKEALA